ncbi:MAG: sarcosine oxidase subunit delta family protein [Rhizobiaceae bacterium]|nr:sarcosine oxidase subunit delta family protein [Rhizobiaceae bacterium]
MRIPCPYCGPRDVGEFTYQGDATVTRPDPASTDQDGWNRYVYDRANPAGKHSEVWQHSGGCRAHLIVERDTLTHAVGAVRYARGSATKAAARPAAKAAAKKTSPRKPATRAKAGK